MSERQVPWRPRPTPEVVALLEQMATTRLYVLHRTGPTSFVIHEDASNINRKVTIGCRPTCTCTPGHSSGASGGASASSAVTTGGTSGKELCLHILFVMVKVLRMPPNNPIVWQLSLTDRELEEVLRCSTIPTQQPSSDSRSSRAQQAGSKREAGAVKRKALDEEEPCPICYEDMVGADSAALVWCKHGCGRNIHGKCMSVWSVHQVRTLCKELSCPLCRADWGPFLWRPPPPNKRKAREERKDVHYGTRCGACRKAPLTGKRFRCLICADLDLCEACFGDGHHPQHPFARKDSPTAYAVAAERPIMMPIITRLGGAAQTPAGAPGPSSIPAAAATTAAAAAVASALSQTTALMQPAATAAGHAQASGSLALAPAAVSAHPELTTASLRVPLVQQRPPGIILQDYVPSSDERAATGRRGGPEVVELSSGRSVMGPGTELDDMGEGQAGVPVFPVPAPRRGARSRAAAAAAAAAMARARAAANDAADAAAGVAAATAVAPLGEVRQGTVQQRLSVAGPPAIITMPTPPAPVRLPVAGNEEIGGMGATQHTSVSGRPPLPSRAASTGRRPGGGGNATMGALAGLSGSSPGPPPITLPVSGLAPIATGIGPSVQAGSSPTIGDAPGATAAASFSSAPLARVRRGPPQARRAAAPAPSPPARLGHAEDDLMAVLEGRAPAAQAAGLPVVAGSSSSSRRNAANAPGPSSTSREAAGLGAAHRTVGGRSAAAIQQAAAADVARFERQQQQRRQQGQQFGVAGHSVGSQGGGGDASSSTPSTAAAAQPLVSGAAPQQSAGGGGPLPVHRRPPLPEHPHRHPPDHTTNTTSTMVLDGRSVAPSLPSGTPWEAAGTAAAAATAADGRPQARVSSLPVAGREAVLLPVPSPSITQVHHSAFGGTVVQGTQGAHAGRQQQQARPDVGLLQLGVQATGYNEQPRQNADQDYSDGPLGNEVVHMQRGRDAPTAAAKRPLRGLAFPPPSSSAAAADSAPQLGDGVPMGQPSHSVGRRRPAPAAAAAAASAHSRRSSAQTAEAKGQEDTVEAQEEDAEAPENDPLPYVRRSQSAGAGPGTAGGGVYGSRPGSAGNTLPGSRPGSAGSTMSGSRPGSAVNMLDEVSQESYRDRVPSGCDEELVQADRSACPSSSCPSSPSTCSPCSPSPSSLTRPAGGACLDHLDQSDPQRQGCDDGMLPHMLTPPRRPSRLLPVVSSHAGDQDGIVQDVPHGGQDVDRNIPLLEIGSRPARPTSDPAFKYSNSKDRRSSEASSPGSLAGRQRFSPALVGVAAADGDGDAVCEDGCVLLASVVGLPTVGGNGGSYGDGGTGGHGNLARCSVSGGCGGKGGDGGSGGYGVNGGSYILGPSAGSVGCSGSSPDVSYMMAKEEEQEELSTSYHEAPGAAKGEAAPGCSGNRARMADDSGRLPLARSASGAITRKGPPAEAGTAALLSSVGHSSRALVSASYRGPAGSSFERQCSPPPIQLMQPLHLPTPSLSCYSQAAASVFVAASAGSAATAAEARVPSHRTAAGAAAAAAASARADAAAAAAAAAEVVVAAVEEEEAPPQATHQALAVTRCSSLPLHGRRARLSSASGPMAAAVGPSPIAPSQPAPVKGSADEFAALGAAAASAAASAASTAASVGASGGGSQAVARDSLWSWMRGSASGAAGKLSVEMSIASAPARAVAAAPPARQYQDNQMPLGVREAGWAKLRPADGEACSGLAGSKQARADTTKSAQPLRPPRPDVNLLDPDPDLERKDGPSVGGSRLVGSRRHRGALPSEEVSEEVLPVGASWQLYQNPIFNRPYIDSLDLATLGH